MSHGDCDARFEFIEIAALDGHSPFLGFGAMDANYPYELKGFGAMEGPINL